MLFMLVGFGLAWTWARWRAGLSYSVDSGIYLMQSARLHNAHEYPNIPTYAPLFPIAIAIGLGVVEFPGQAAVLVLGVSMTLALLGFYVAARSAGASRLMALLGAALFLLLPSTNCVFQYAWTEGPLIGGLMVILAAWSRWLGTRRSRWLVLTWVAASIVPLIKYIAIVAPLVIAVLVMTRLLSRPGKARATWPQVVGSAAMFLPIMLHLLRNYLTAGVVTGHAARHTPLGKLWSTPATTLQSAFSLPARFYLAIGLGALLYGAFRRRWRIDTASPLLATVLITCGFFGMLLVAASQLRIDALDARLAAPGLALIPLCAAQAIGSLGPLSWDPRPSFSAVTTIASACVLVVAIAQPLWNLGYELQDSVAGHPVETRQVFEAGFGLSRTRIALSKLYQGELMRTHSVSATFVVAEPAIGQIRHFRPALAAGLAMPPLASQLGSRLVAAQDEGVDIEVSGGLGHVWLLPAGIEAMAPAARNVRSNRRRLAALVGARVAYILEHVVQAARQHRRAEHWVMIPERAGWLDLRGGGALGARVTAVRRLPGYVAYEVTL